MNGDDLEENESEEESEGGNQFKKMIKSKIIYLLKNQFDKFLLMKNK